MEDAGVYASGRWQVADGQADLFVERWRDFLTWTRDEHPELEFARLIRSETDPNRFVSFASWGSAEARNAWKQSPGFAERVSACRALCDDFQGDDFSTAVAI